MTASGLTRRGVLLGSAAALAMPAAAKAATLAEIKKRGYMTVATEDDFRPFEFTVDGKPTGYDQELLEMFKKKAGFEVRQDIIPWTGILPGVTTGKYDAAWTAVLVTQERMKTLDFCAPVAESVDYYLKRKGDKQIQGIKDLSGLPLGVEAGSAMLKLLPQLDEMLEDHRRQPGQDRVLPGLSGSVSGFGARPRRLCGQRLAEPANDRQGETRHLRSRPSGFQANLHRLARW